MAICGPQPVVIVGRLIGYSVILSLLIHHQFRKYTAVHPDHSCETTVKLLCLLDDLSVWYSWLCRNCYRIPLIVHYHYVSY